MATEFELDAYLMKQFLFVKFQTNWSIPENRLILLIKMFHLASNSNPNTILVFQEVDFLNRILISRQIPT